jgi:hypothetical protein
VSPVAGLEKKSSMLMVDLLWSNWLDLLQISGMALLLVAQVHQIQIAVLGIEYE